MRKSSSFMCILKVLLLGGAEATRAYKESLASLVLPVVILSGHGVAAVDTCTKTQTCTFIPACDATCKPAPAVQVSESGGYATILVTLAVMLIATLTFAGYRYVTKGRIGFDKDSYFSARNSQRAIWLALSYFVSGMGLWVIFAVPDATFIGGTIAMVGYALSTVAPLMLFYICVPFLRRNLPQGTTFWEYTQSRFGTYNTIIVGITSLFFMFIYTAAELTSVGNLSAALCKIPKLKYSFFENDYSLGGQPVAPILATAMVTLIYTSFGGLPLSIITDRTQGLGVIVFVFIICIAGYSKAGEKDRNLWDTVSNRGTADDFGISVAIAFNLIMGVCCASMIHAGYWQRVWAADSDWSAKAGLVGASVLSFIVMVLFGVVSMVGYAIYGDNIIGANGATSLVVGELPEGWHVFLLIIGVGMGASTIDTLQSAMQALLSPPIDATLEKLFGMKESPRRDKLALLVNFVLMLAINAGTIIIALSGLSVLQLFLLADLFAAAVVAPLALGFWYRTNPFAAIVGMVAGYATIFIVYAIAGENGDKGLGALTCVGWAATCDYHGGIFYRHTAYAFAFSPIVSGLTTWMLSVRGALEWSDKGEGVWALVFNYNYRFLGFPAVLPAVKPSVVSDAKFAAAI